MPPSRPTRRTALALALAGLAACGRRPSEPALSRAGTAETRAMVDRYAALHRLPPALMHRVVERESGYDAGARNGPYLGLMQIHPDTARSMGFRGEPAQLLDPATNLRYGGAYLRGAWIVANGDHDEAVRWYSRGYYYEARDRGLLEETGLRRS